MPERKRKGESKSPLNFCLQEIDAKRKYAGSRPSHAEGTYAVSFFSRCPDNGPTVVNPVANRGLYFRQGDGLTPDPGSRSNKEFTLARVWAREGGSELGVSGEETVRGGRYWEIIRLARPRQQIWSTFGTGGRNRGAAEAGRKGKRGGGKERVGCWKKKINLNPSAGSTTLDLRKNLEEKKGFILG